MKVAVAGTGYVGLVTGVVLAHIGHDVTCVDRVEDKIKLMQQDICTIYEQDLERLMKENKNRLNYTTDYQKAYRDADVIFIGVGTPEREDGSANLDYIYDVAEEIALSINKDTVVVIKSTVPVGTNDNIEEFFKRKTSYNVSVVSNPEFLSQGTAVKDSLSASRIIVGVEDDYSKGVMRALYQVLIDEGIPYLEMDRRSAEMVKYASNDFLALKISYINEIANFCEKVGANIYDVTNGMSYDSRIGNQFMNAGIGYGGSCFPKDTKALHFLSLSIDSELKTIKASIEVNKSQRLKLFSKVKDFYGSHNLKNMHIALLGATFKPGTDDLREAPSVDNIKAFLDYGTKISIYDPVGLNNLKNIFGDKIEYIDNIDECIKDKDLVLIMTEWDEIKGYDLSNYSNLMHNAVVYDGRNCYDLDEVRKHKMRYVSIGRMEVNNLE